MEKADTSQPERNTMPKPEICVTYEGKGRMCLITGTLRSSLWGFLVMVSGAVILFLALHFNIYQPSSQHSGSRYPDNFQDWIVALILFASVIGGTLALGRSTTTLNLEKGLIERKRFLVFLPVWSKILPLSVYNQVTIQYDCSGSGARVSTTREQFLLRLEGKKKFTFATTSRFEEGKTLAKAVAQFLQIPFLDQTNGKGRR